VTPAGVVTTLAGLAGYWLAIWTNTFTGPLNFSDPQSNVSSNRLYRAHVP